MSEDREELTAKEAIELGVEYSRLKTARMVLNDGEILEPEDHKTALERVKGWLKEYVGKHGDLFVEGVGTLHLQQRSGGTKYDLNALQRNDPATLARMAELGCLRVDEKVLKAQIDAGNIATAPKGRRMGGAPALVILSKGN